MIKELILDATNSECICSVVGKHVGTVAFEMQEARINTVNRTAPIEAVDIIRTVRTIVAVAEARHSQFKRRSKSAC
jgi:hypothetical protein